MEAAQAILSVTVLLAVLLPVMYLSGGGRRTIAVELVFLFLVEAMLIGIGWLPAWLMIATIAVMAIAIALQGTKVVVGG